MTKLGENLYGKEVTEFICGICYKTGKFENGAKVCRECKHAVHEKCSECHDMLTVGEVDKDVMMNVSRFARA